MTTRTSWTVESWNGSSWDSATSIYRPNEPLSIDLTANQQKLILADGSQAFVSPENKIVRDPLRFIWLEIEADDSFVNTILGYVNNQNYLRITTHLSEQLIGRFISIRRIHLSGVEDTYDFESAFDRKE